LAQSHPMNDERNPVSAEIAAIRQYVEWAFAQCAGGWKARCRRVLAALDGIQLGSDVMARRLEKLQDALKGSNDEVVRLAQRVKFLEESLNAVESQRSEELH
jgi:hypothetical protein